MLVASSERISAELGWTSAQTGARADDRRCLGIHPGPSRRVFRLGRPTACQRGGQHQASGGCEAHRSSGSGRARWPPARGRHRRCGQEGLVDSSSSRSGAPPRPSLSASRPSVGSTIEQQGPVGGQAAGGEPVDFPDRVDAEFAAGPLVGQRGVHEPVQQHQRATVQERHAAPRARAAPGRPRTTAPRPGLTPRALGS